MVAETAAVAATAGDESGMPPQAERARCHTAAHTSECGASAVASTKARKLYGDGRSGIDGVERRPNRSLATTASDASSCGGYTK